ncbi:g6636 [Coccomyxa viridis]|uniref:G6636 protein n=1 Tax=Coccomyxa viridis TaxID=1274662 RepID=A0ABP1FYB0_9CHLO
MPSKDMFKEQVVTPEQWVYKSSWKRHLPDFTWIHILRGNWFWVFYFSLLPILLSIYESVLVPELGAPAWPSMSNTPYLFQPFSLTSFALALLITFRTNSCYARWWEARTIWGRIVNETRNLARQSTAWFPEDDDALLEQFNRWVQALGYILKCHLGSGDLTTDLQGILTKDELELLVSWQFRPSVAAQVLSDIVQQAGLREGQHVTLDLQISAYVDDAGACDRIQKTCIPQSYTRHTSRFLMIFLTFLPFTLWEVTGWLSPFAEALIAFLFMGIDNIGTQIEEPFATLPLGAYCEMMSRHAKEQYDRRKGPLATVLRVQRASRASSNEAEHGSLSAIISPRNRGAMHYNSARTQSQTQHRHSFSFQAPPSFAESHSLTADDKKVQLPLKGLNRHPSCNV